MLTKERPDFRTVDRWATNLLLEVAAIRKCDQYGWAKDRTDPHAREEALRIATYALQQNSIFIRPSHLRGQAALEIR